MPSYETVKPNQAPGYLLRSSHADGFFSEEERSRRRKVLARIPALSGKQDFKLNEKLNLEDFGNQDYLETTRRGSLTIPDNNVDEEKEQVDGVSYPNMISAQEDADKKKLNSAYMETKEGYNDVINSKDIRDRIATKAFYTSTTQKLYQGTEWDASRNCRPDPPSTVLEPRPDMVTQRFSRYEDKPESWQKFSSRQFTWDYLQTRNGHYARRPFAFTSQCKKVGQIPNYTGHVAGDGEKDVNGESFTPLTKLRLEKPRYTTTSKRGYVPGYTGCVLWANDSPPLSAEKEPRRESTARVHKPLSTPRTSSAHKHQGPLSRMVTLTHPFNPYNKKYPFDGITASGNRV